LTTINNEAKVRRSTKSVVLGRAKVMSYKDLIAKRAEREAKEQAKEKGKGKRGRKSKNLIEVDASEPGKRGRKRKSPPDTAMLEPKVKVTCISEALEPVTALVARMI
jgi:hypothetical protein